MSKKTNPALIGAFVIGAMLLIVASFAVFGGAELLAKKNRYAAYFVEPTKGLHIGANVLLNGVRVGQVSDIDLLVDELNYEIKTRVAMEVFPDTFIVTRNGEAVGSDLVAVGDHDKLIHEAGLRAQLEVESFVTGKLQVELTLRPETEARLLGTDPPYPEIPAIPSNIHELMDKVQDWAKEIQRDVDVAELGKRLTSILAGVDGLVNSQEVRDSLAGISALINDQSTQEVMASLKATLDELRAVAADAGRLIRDTDEDIGVLVADLGPVLARLTETLSEAEQTFAAAKLQLRGESPQMYQLDSTLHDLELAAQAVREFFDYLERNPEAMLRGKSE